jgi:DNA mismatch endonuclease, patch repair protein
MTKKLPTKTYIRDGRAPIPANENTSRAMSANKAKNTKPELILRRALWKEKIKGYRTHPKKVTGKPDIAFIGKKVAIFVNGCFWHRCPHCNLSLPKSNIDFWENKFRKNRERDDLKSQTLVLDNWKVLVVWECQIKNNITAIVKQISDLIK